MTDEERKNWDRLVAARSHPMIVQVSDYDLAILAADAEMKRLREEREKYKESIEWAIKYRDENKRLREAVYLAIKYIVEMNPQAGQIMVDDVRRRAGMEGR